MACDYINTELNKCIVENKLECYRCGRDGHLANTCYAKNHINADIGQHIIDTKEEELNICYRCGRDGHLANACYAKRHIHGYIISDVTNDEHNTLNQYIDNKTECYRCARTGHLANTCIAKRHVTGPIINNIMTPVLCQPPLNLLD